MLLPPAISHFVCTDAGRVWVAPAYVETFRQHGLTHFASFMQYAEGERIKKNLYREILRFALPGTPYLFLKRHFTARFWDTVWAWLRRAKSQAYHELEAIGYLQAIGVSTLQPVAFGEIHPLGQPCQSFLITEELSGSKLQYYLPSHQQKWQEDLLFRHELIRQLAEMAALLHSHYLHHQDFYLGHILLELPNGDNGRFRLRLLDLQRLYRRRPLARRWRIKDLAELHYSAPTPLVSRSDRLRFWYHYSGSRELTAAARYFIAAIERWRNKIARHQEHKLSRSRGRH
jgi:heptose I phosphotransferase